MQDKVVTNYKDWNPLISPEEVYSESIKIGSLKAVGEVLFWIESRSEEKGRQVIVKRTADGKEEDLTPKDFYVRTRVHEYGGGSYLVDETYVYFVNFADQRLYKQNWNEISDPEPLTLEKNADGSLGKYAAMKLTPDKKHLIFVYEKELSDRENENYLASLNLAKNMEEPTIIAKGADFYGDPVISADGVKIAWISWNHPNMPWDGTELWQAELENGLIIPETAELIIGKETENQKSIIFPKYDHSGDLYFVMDEEGKDENDPLNWWNIYRVNQATNEVVPVTQELAELGNAMWSFDYSTYHILHDGRIACSVVQKGISSLWIFDPSDSSFNEMDLPYCSIISINSYKNNLFFIASSSNETTRIVNYSLEDNSLEAVKTCGTTPLTQENIAIPKPISYPTSDNQEAHALFYEPKNNKYQVPENEKPPLIVFVHGGPTSKTSAAYDSMVQFWTTQGYAIFDVNHRGSTGYGRKFRDQLKGKWGLIDIQDVKDGVEFLIKEGIIDNKAAITGGSAGGYSVQRALTYYPDLFKVGASYFGIGNLLTLAKMTHKFEARYLDSLIGASLPDGEEVYIERSPINFLDQLKAPMILFQGSDDKVVTPKNSIEVAEILKEKGIKYEYFEYEGEGHGFRMKESKVDSLSKEAKFYKETLYT